jgi:hypothetical protein
MMLFASWVQRGKAYMYEDALSEHMRMYWKLLERGTCITSILRDCQGTFALVVPAGGEFDSTVSTHCKQVAHLEITLDAVEYILDPKTYLLAMADNFPQP